MNLQIETVCKLAHAPAQVTKETVKKIDVRMIEAAREGNDTLLRRKLDDAQLRAKPRASLIEDERSDIAADHKNQNAKLMPFIEKKVKVTGLAVQKGGLEGVVIKTVEAAE